MVYSPSVILRKIKKLKQRNFGEIIIKCNFNNFDYVLLLLTADCERNSTLMELIGRWRKENEMWFLSQFPVTTERTTKWFKERVIDAPDRLLFLIKIDGKYLGHIGLFRFDFEKNTCEIDNIVRGEPDYPGIMGNAVLHMMGWGKNVLGLRCYLLKVISDNERAIRFYNRLGFKEVSRIPLIQVEGNDGLEWVEIPEGCRKDANRHYIVMKLSI